jgi:hypothetical protein
MGDGERYTQQNRCPPLLVDNKTLKALEHVANALHKCSLTAAENFNLQSIGKI